MVFAVVAAIQVPGCSVSPSTAPPSSGSRSFEPSARADSNAHSHAAIEGFAQCPQHFPGHAPAVAWPGRQRALCFDGFAALYSGESKTPLYTAQKLTRASVEAAKGIRRVDRFYPEARLPAADRAQLADYVGSGYDRGHLSPAGDMPSVTAKAQSFSLANMVPQAPKLNQGAWNQIEQSTRKYAARATGPVFVFTGPSFDRQPDKIGPGKVWVPSHTWKVVYSSGDGRAWAYWTLNHGGTHSLQPISYREFEQRSGLALLPEAVH